MTTYAMIRDITSERATIVSTGDDPTDFCSEYTMGGDCRIVALSPDYDYEDGERIVLLRDVVGAKRRGDGSVHIPSARE